ncbi:hypothetical protein [Mesorhizobium sp.]|uniref:hypothetical protein n=1 Tax=Mesorhizobium sp. TaxID=1871066 RepID=UPI000FE99E16|nr:hypothetical protein [Mesorhizobium sp.]RWQ22120.1 MAG: hypothetical protein EOR93_10745 [Mesorhizobium sp.]
MTFDEAMRDAALAAKGATEITTAKYAGGGLPAEPEISTYLIAQLDAKFGGGRIGGLNWSSSIVSNGSGKAADEKRIGADILLHVEPDTPTQKYSKGVLIQAKKTGASEVISPTKLSDLQGQCLRMLNHTAASFVINYTKSEMRIGPATRFSGTTNRKIHEQCTWTAYRFFLELFRCPVGDTRIHSEKVLDLPPPHIIYLQAEGHLTHHEG